MNDSDLVELCRPMIRGFARNLTRRADAVGLHYAPAQLTVDFVEQGFLGVLACLGRWRSKCPHVSFPRYAARPAWWAMLRFLLENAKADGYRWTFRGHKRRRRNLRL